MNKAINKSIWWVFAAMCIMIGLYPIIYFVIDRHFGLLSSKSSTLLSDQIWNIAFYCHIVLGGLALLVGWTQFWTSLRNKRMRLHRTIGKIYVVSVLISGVCGIYIAQFATGGMINVVAFSSSGIVWLFTTLLAFKAIKNGNIALHQKMMIYSYAVCFSAVTLRIWLPILIGFTGEFISAYRMVGFLSWVPNLLVAYLITKRIG